MDWSLVLVLVLVLVLLLDVVDDVFLVVRLVSVGKLVGAVTIVENSPLVDDGCTVVMTVVGS